MSSKLRKAMVLAAGSGRRLRPLTARLAKPALPLMGRPLIEYVLRRLARVGIEEVVVNLHHRPETIEPSLARADAELDLVVHRSFEPELLGTAGGLKRAAEHFASAPFLLLNSDTLVDFDIEELFETHCRSGALATLLLRPKPLGSTYTGIRVGSDGRIVSVSKLHEDDELMFSGVWVLEPAVLDLLSGAPAGLERELLPRLVASGAATGSIQERSWVTIDTPQHYWTSVLSVARAGLFEDEWNGSRIGGDPAGSSVVVVGPGTRVSEQARLFGGVVLGSECRIAAGAELDNVICWDRVEIPADARLHNCVLTDDVRLTSGVDWTDRLVMPVGADRSTLRKREIRDDLVVAHLKSAGATGL